MNKNSMYALVVCLLALSVYLKSPMVGVSTVVLVAVEYLRDILMKNNIVKDIEDLKGVITALQSQANSERNRREILEKEMANVRQRVSDFAGDI